ncbi:placenta-specific gene 8 protein-like [Chaetodon trifascialis]|uniref:placenta-specific gene 8 protein-like n=1 Tax=Chaetodon trifascialis TaxID=109706 RepID=UPI0039957473
MAVTNQPGQYESSDFHSGLCDCCQDCKICCLTLWCCPCMGICIANDMKECCMCGLGMTIRSVYRTRYNIRGSLCTDYLVTTFLGLCATCQLKRDIDHRKELGIF